MSTEVMGSTLRPTLACTRPRTRLRPEHASYEEAAQILGASKLRTALSITAPLVAPGDAVEVSIRPENIRLTAAANAAGQPAKITNHVFLGNISEYYATLPSGQMLRVQTHPPQQFKVGDPVAIEVDAAHCSVFRRSSGDAVPA